MAFVGEVRPDLLTHKQAVNIIICRVKSHLEPLAVATNIAQSAHCRLDQVLLMFGLLHHWYTSLRNQQQSEDELACNAILESLERRWAKADQDVFVAAVILNPFHKTAPFAKTSTIFSNAGVLAILSRLWTRFYKEEPPYDLFAETEDYLECKGSYEILTTWLPWLQRKAQQEVHFVLVYEFQTDKSSDSAGP